MGILAGLAEMRNSVPAIGSLMLDERRGSQDHLLLRTISASPRAS